jgi:hypothetical protein
MLFSDWSGENWRWYINDLEVELDAASSKTLIAPIDQPPTPEVGIKPIPFTLRKYAASFPRPSRTDSRHIPGLNEVQSPRAPFEAPSPAATLTEHQGSPVSIRDEQINQKWGNTIWKSDRPAKRTFGRIFKGIHSRKLGVFHSRRRASSSSNGSSSSSRTASIDNSSQLSEKNKSMETSPAKVPQLIGMEASGSLNIFTMGDLQRIQHVEEKLQETSLMLKFNVQILKELREHYRYVISLSSFPLQIRTSCEYDIERFYKRILDVEKDMIAQQSRIEMLLCQSAQRKQLMGEILQYRSMRATEMSAHEAQSSADNMEALTDSMHDIASKTKRETVSMRVITSVTLFFLPGTFVATFMSTDIIRFSDEPGFHLKGLKIYLAISLPIMALTFLAWFLVYQLARRRDRLTRGTLPDRTCLV